ncbi:unnamed protein product [Aphanomyces euteiches]
MYNEQIGYYDRFKDESKPHTENLPVPQSARPVLDQTQNMPPIEPQQPQVAGVASRSRIICPFIDQAFVNVKYSE